MMDTIDDVQSALTQQKYICERDLATSVYLSRALEKPLLLEGEAGVGKTEVGKVVARSLGAKLIRLQCYEGLDAEHALYEWNYQKQILEIQMAHARQEEGRDTGNVKQRIFSEEFLLKRPLLEAIQSPAGETVLLIDEVDRADEGFEAFLLEVLSDFQITIPEIGTLKAVRRPLVFLTSNDAREMSDALKRRCLHLFIDFPDEELELKILDAKVPGVDRRLMEDLVQLMQRLRQLDLKKIPSISETLDWARALLALNASQLDEQTVQDTLNVILKYEGDIRKAQSELNKLLAQKAQPPAAGPGDQPEAPRPAKKGVLH